MMILTNTNYLDFDRQELLKIGFTSEQINEVVYGDLKQTRLKEKEVKDVLNAIGREPLFGHPTNSKCTTHWFTFMKIPEESK